MSFHIIAVNHRGMAPLQLVRNTEGLFHRPQIVTVVQCDPIARLTQRDCPRAAAAAPRFLCTPTAGLTAACAPVATVAISSSRIRLFMIGAFHVNAVGLHASERNMEEEGNGVTALTSFEDPAVLRCRGR